MNDWELVLNNLIALLIREVCKQLHDGFRVCIDFGCL